MAQSKRAKVANYLCRLNFRSPLGSASKINGFCGDGRARPPLKPPFQWGDQKGPRGDAASDHPISAFASKARAVSRSATRSTRAFSIFAETGIQEGSLDPCGTAEHVLRVWENVLHCGFGKTMRMESRMPKRRFRN